MITDIIENGKRLYIAFDTEAAAYYGNNSEILCWTCFKKQLDKN